MPTLFKKMRTKAAAGYLKRVQGKTSLPLADSFQKVREGRAVLKGYSTKQQGANILFEALGIKPRGAQSEMPPRHRAATRSVARAMEKNDDLLLKRSLARARARQMAGKKSHVKG